MCPVRFNTFSKRSCTSYTIREYCTYNCLCVEIIGSTCSLLSTSIDSRLFSVFRKYT
ncbi:unnamed protein product [Trichobilharzia regenti]|nr:unnamed protein product [Trichobilharzia regenti]